MNLFDIFVLQHSMTAKHFAWHDVYMYVCMKACLHAYMHIYIVTCSHVIFIQFQFSCHTFEHYLLQCNAGIDYIYVDSVTGQMYCVPQGTNNGEIL